MKKFFSVLLIISVMSIAVFSLGGCGSSSSKSANHSRKVATDEAVYLIGSFDSPSVKDTLLNELFELFWQEKSADRDISDVSSNDLVFIADLEEEDYGDINIAYNNEAVLALLSPTKGKIIKLLDALNLSDYYKVPKNPEGELFLIQLYKGEEFLFYLPSTSDEGINFGNDEDIVITEDVESRASSLNFVKDDRNFVTDSEVSNDEEVIFNEILNWARKDSKKSNESSNSPEIKISAKNGDLKDLVSKGTYEGVFSTKSSEKDDLDNSPNHKWLVNYTVYALHSFIDGCDYYIVEAKSKSNPKSQIFHSVENLSKKPDNESKYYMCSIDVAEGYTQELTFKNVISGDEDEISKINVVESTPNIDSSGTARDFTYNFGRNIGYKKAEGSILNFDALQYYGTFDGGKPDCSLKKEDETEWNLVMAAPVDGKDYTSNPPKNLPTSLYKGLDVQDASSKLREDNFVWIWQVPRSYWEKNGRPKYFVTTATASHGRTEGFGYFTPASGNKYRVARIDTKWYESTKTENIPLPIPPHIAVTGNYMEPRSGAGHYTFSLMSEGDWIAETDVDWITLKNSSGEATTDGASFLFWYDYAQNTTGKNRTGTITITSSLGESVTIKVYQSK